MRRSDKEVKDSSLINDIMADATICRIAMCDGNEPYIVPMNFGFDKDYIYLHSAREGKKLEILRKNNKVCFEVDIKTELVKRENLCNWGMKYFSVIGKGEVSFINNVDEKKDALNIIIKKYTDIQPDFNDTKVDNIEILKIKITEISGKQSGY